MARARGSEKSPSRARFLAAARDADLTASGLDTAALIKKLQLDKILDLAETKELTGVEEAVAYEIPYFDLHGHRLSFRRVKIIGVGDKEPGMKYWQAPSSIPHLYLPPLMDWAKIAKNPKQRIIVTEGEKKAACACNYKLPTIGVGGVWAHKSAKYGLDLIRDFDWFEWNGREVEICFDADLAENDDVRRAKDNFAAAMRIRGARVFTRLLPNTDGASKLDDFLVKHGVKRYEKLSVEEDGGSRELSLLNERLTYVEQVQAYFGIRERVMYRDVSSLKKQYGPIRIPDERGKSTPAVETWVEWAGRRAVDKLTFVPGASEFVDGSYNTWQAHTLQPKRGDVSQFLTLIRSLENWQWFLQWLAYPLQHRGAKLYSACLIWSRLHGTGKTFIADVMRDIYGPTNSSKISSAQLHSSFNAWAAHKEFIVGEEISTHANKEDYNALKLLVTSDTITVNQKYSPEYELPNVANFYFTSNDPAAIRLESADRRFYVTSLDDVKDKKFWTELDRWRKEGGPAAFFHYLLNEVDTKSFDPKANAPMTDTKRQVIYTGMTALDQWCIDLVADPEALMDAETRALSKRDVFTVSQIASWYPGDDLRHDTLGKSLIRAGAVPSTNGVRHKSGRHRMFALKNLDYWKQNRSAGKLWAENHDMEVTGDRKLGDRPRAKVVKIREGV